MNEMNEMNLEDLRVNIDEIDVKIVRLIAQRIRLAQEIGRKKKQIVDRERETVVYKNVKAIAEEEGMRQEDIVVIYRQIVVVCKRAQDLTTF